VSRIITHSAAVQAPLRARLAQRRSSQIIRAPLAAPPVVVVAVGYVLVETSHYHLPAKHDPVALASEGAFAVLLLVLVIVGFETVVRVVRRPLP
jgi:hypothetical protein